MRQSCIAGAGSPQPFSLVPSRPQSPVPREPSRRDPADSAAMSEMLLSEPFTRSEAHAAGVSSRKLAALIESGVVERPFAGVYLPAALGDTPEVRMRAMARLLPPGAVLVRESAAWAHGIDVRPPDRFRAPPKLEVASPSSFDLNAVRRDGVHGHLLHLPPSDVTMVAGVPVTTAARTAVDLAR